MQVKVVDMKLLILALTATACMAAQLPTRTYLPPQSPQTSSFTQSQSSFGTGGAIGLASGSGGNGGSRPQQAAERVAQILKSNQELTAEGSFRYNFETSNGITVEESRDQSQSSKGGYSYKGDDGVTYTITFTAGDGGYQAQGAHLPVAPAIPDEIRLALEQNAKDEAAGIFDDGSYDAAKYGGDDSWPQGISSSSGHSSSSSHSTFGSASHQGTFNQQSGYRY